ncbi:MAG: PssE/Cps14G family polysaccharide biosynthesis glycosyltransferase [Breznakia sp.]
MIFVTLGTQDKSFHRLLMKLDELIEKDVIQSDIIVQAGNTKYKSKNMKILNFINMSEFNHYVADCEYLITHAGVGSIMNGLDHQKKVIAVARRVQYGEHENDHQVEITNKFAELQYIIGCCEVCELEENLKKLHTFQTKPYTSNNQSFCQRISGLIDMER